MFPSYLIVFSKDSNTLKALLTDYSHQKTVAQNRINFNLAFDSKNHSETLLTKERRRQDQCLKSLARQYPKHNTLIQCSNSVTLPLSVSYQTENYHVLFMERLSIYYLVKYLRISIPKFHQLTQPKC